MTVFKHFRTALVAARLTRLITTDTLGDWFIIRPVERRAERDEERADHDRQCTPGNCRNHHRQAGLDALESGHPRTVTGKILTGLECPFCVGFWVTLGVVTAERLASSDRMPTHLRTVYEAVSNALAINYVAAHVSARLD